MNTFCHRSPLETTSIHAVYAIPIPDKHSRAIARLVLIIHGIDVVIRCGSHFARESIYVRGKDAETAIMLIGIDDSFN